MSINCSRSIALNLLDRPLLQLWDHAESTLTKTASKLCGKCYFQLYFRDYFLSIVYGQDLCRFGFFSSFFPESLQHVVSIEDENVTPALDRQAAVLLNSEHFGFYSFLQKAFVCGIENTLCLNNNCRIIDSRPRR